MRKRGCYKGLLNATENDSIFEIAVPDDCVRRCQGVQFALVQVGLQSTVSFNQMQKASFFEYYYKRHSF